MNTKLLEFLLARYKQHKQRKCDTTLAHCMHIADVMRSKAKYCFLISNGGNYYHQNKNDIRGWCSARLVEPVFRKDGESFTIGIGT